MHKLLILIGGSILLIFVGVALASTPVSNVKPKAEPSDIELPTSLLTEQQPLATVDATPMPPADFTELKITDLVVGSGDPVKSGDTVVIHYSGTLVDGTKFDSSYDRGQPFETQIGIGRVIAGWDQGVVGMQVGGKRKLEVPSALAYGQRGAPPTIAPNTPLVFELELLGIK